MNNKKLLRWNDICNLVPKNEERWNKTRDDSTTMTTTMIRNHPPKSKRRRRSTKEDTREAEANPIIRCKNKNTRNNTGCHNSMVG